MDGDAWASRVHRGDVRVDAVGDGDYELDDLVASEPGSHDMQAQCVVTDTERLGKGEVARARGEDGLHVVEFDRRTVIAVVRIAGQVKDVLPVRRGVWLRGDGLGAFPEQSDGHSAGQDEPAHGEGDGHDRDAPLLHDSRRRRRGHVDERRGGGDQRDGRHEGRRTLACPVGRGRGGLHDGGRRSRRRRSRVYGCDSREGHAEHGPVGRKGGQRRRRSLGLRHHRGCGRGGSHAGLWHTRDAQHRPIHGLRGLGDLRRRSRTLRRRRGGKPQHRYVLESMARARRPSGRGRLRADLSR